MGGRLDSDSENGRVKYKFKFKFKFKLKIQGSGPVEPQYGHFESRQEMVDA